MPPLLGLYLVGAVLLVAAGAMKAMRPGDTARALAPLLPGRLAGIRLVRAGVRSVAAAEAVAGVVAILSPGPWTAVVLAVSYAGFAGWVALARSRGGALASCGCFGTPDTPATAAHLVTDLVLAGSAATVAAGFLVWHDPRGWLTTVVGHQPLHGVPLLAASAIAAYVAYLVLTVLARLLAARSVTGLTWRPPR